MIKKYFEYIKEADETQNQSNKLLESYPYLSPSISIQSLCREYNITNYSINDDGSIDVDGDVNLSEKASLTYGRLWSNKLPLKFRNVTGNFNCTKNELTSLEGAPKSVGGDFNCYDNQLTSLEGAPESVGRNFNCYGNQLTSLEGSPKSVVGSYECANNKLTSLEGGPQSVGGNFYCYDNQLTSLEGSPKSVNGSFYCRDNQLTSLEGAPQSVGRDFECSNNQLTTLEGAPKSVGGVFDCNGNPCYPIYKGWISGVERGELLDMMEYYDFLKGDTIIWNRLESFFEDNELELPSKEELEKNYKII